jgi:hypothetical protein
MEKRTYEELELDLAKLSEELSFWQREAKRIDNNWVKTFQEYQARFNDKVAEVRMLREIVEAKKQEGLTYG